MEIRRLSYLFGPNSPTYNIDLISRKITMHSVEITGIFSTHLSQKFRESNGFTKLASKELISPNFFW